MNKLSLAVLIDGENVPASHMPAIMDRAKRLGEPLALCVVGDFSAGKLAEWAALAPKHALELIFQLSAGKGKNSADIALTIRAMDLLAEKRFDRFLIVSSDRDFAPLALRLRRSGITVYGMGEEEKSGTAWRNACTEFRELTRVKPAPKASEEPIANPPVPSPPKKSWNAEDRDAVRRILDAAAPEDAPWIKLSQLGQHIHADSMSLGKRLAKGRLLENLRSDLAFVVRGKRQTIEVRLKTRGKQEQLLASSFRPPTTPPSLHPHC